MIPIGKLKSNLEFNKNLGDLVEVMKMASTLQFNQFRLKKEPLDEPLHWLDDVFWALVSSGVKSDLLTGKDDLPALFVVVTSDEGFLGESNFLLINKLFLARRAQDHIACIGQQGENYLKEAQVDFSFFDSPGDKIDAVRLIAVRDFILKQYLKRSVGKVYIIFSRFVNIAMQQTEMETLLPLPKAQGSALKPIRNLLIEPDPSSVIEGWIKIWLDFRLYQLFWSSKLAELAARIMHLEGSVQELGKINSHLRREYFKYLHGLSDKSIRELSAGRLLRKVN
jgi:ATP synthase F1 gamma subunit